MKRDKSEMVKKGYMSASAWLHDDNPESGACVVAAVYLSDTYETLRERVVKLAKDGSYLLDYDPRNEPIIGKTWKKEWERWGFNFRETSNGMIPEQKWFEFESGWVMAVRTWFNELPEGTKTYSQSAKNYMERVSASQDKPKRKYKTTKQKQGKK